MIKMLALIKRLSAMDRSDFREHYEERHAPLALPLLEGLSRYVRYHVVSEPFGEPGFDVLTGFWYRDQAAADRVFTRLEGEEGDPLREDELRFMDKSGNRFFPVSERVLMPGDEGEEHLFVLVSRPEGMSRFDCSTKLARDHWPRLIDRIESPRFALLRDAFPMHDVELPCDSVLQVGPGSSAGLDRWGRSLEAEGFRVTAVGARRYETKLDTALLP